MASRVYRMQMRSHMVQIIGACGILFSCAHTTPEPSPPLPNFNSVAIASSGADGTLNVKYGAPPEDSKVATGVAVGAGAGAVWGTLIGLACGPFAPACLPVTIPLMTATGVATGGVAGAVDDASTKPSKGQTELLADIFLEISRQRIIHQEVGDAFERMIPPGRLVESTAADALLQLGKVEARFFRKSSDRYGLSLKTALVVAWDRDQGQVQRAIRIYEYHSGSLPLNEWTHDEGESINSALDACVHGLAARMRQDIHFTRF